MGRHRFFSPDFALHERVPVTGEEAHHAVRSKRLDVGETVELFDGRGVTATGVVESITRPARQSGFVVSVEVRERVVVPASRPRIEVFAAPPKGDRLEMMIDQLSQVGADVYAPLLAERTVVEPRAGKMERLRRVALESMKQCGRAWTMEVDEPRELRRVVEDSACDSGMLTLVADAGGVSPGACVRAGGGVSVIRVIVGPEGGLSPEELTMCVERGVRSVSLGAHVLRIETAAVVASAVVAMLARSARTLTESTGGA